jgi:hypothetical protein
LHVRFPPIPWENITTGYLLLEFNGACCHKAGT